ncbi:MAG: M81 family metallopeptidase [Geminicoccaceae bacterium]
MTVRIGIANLSQAMVELADMLIVYKTYPHIDMAARGREATDALAATALPACVFRKFPLLTAPQMQVTGQAPIVGLNVGDLHSSFPRAYALCARPPARRAVTADVNRSQFS